MSLLMDALKRAEREKREAAEKLRESNGEGSEELSLTDKYDYESYKKPETLSDDTEAEGAESLELEAPGNDELPPDLQEEEESTLELPKMGDTTGVDFGDNTGEQSRPIFNMQESSLEALERTGKNTTADHFSFQQPPTPEEPEEETDATSSSHESPFSLSDGDKQDAPAMAPGKNSEQTLLDRSRIKLDSSDSRLSRSIISAAELANDIGSGKGRPTPVAAQTVFTAAAGKPGPNALFRLGLVIAICMVIAVAFGVFYYQTISPMTPQVTPAQLANRAELAPVITTDIDDIREAATSPETGVVVTEGSLADEPITNQLITDDTVAESIEESTVTESDSAETLPPAESIVSDKVTILQPEQVALQAPDAEKDFPDIINEANISNQPAEFEPEKTLPEKITVTPEAIRISRSKSLEEKSVQINSAYTDYIAGRYQAAAMKYRAILSDLPENQDALLGLAAIAHRQGNVSGAYEYYLNVLKLYPQNKTAKVALLNLQNKTDPTENASIIKLLIQEEPQSPYLHFSLGNLYADQLRWPDAQQAFFNAYSLDAGNPDYVFNLAVSLDQMGQHKAALDYYKIALELADQRPVDYNLTNVLSRVNTLSSNASKR